MLYSLYGGTPLSNIEMMHGLEGRDIILLHDVYYLKYQWIYIDEIKQVLWNTHQGYTNIRGDANKNKFKYSTTSITAKSSLELS